MDSAELHKLAVFLSILRNHHDDIELSLIFPLFQPPLKNRYITIYIHIHSKGEDSHDCNCVFITVCIYFYAKSEVNFFSSPASIFYPP